MDHIMGLAVAPTHDALILPNPKKTFPKQTLTLKIDQNNSRKYDISTIVSRFL